VPTSPRWGEVIRARGSAPNPAIDIISRHFNYGLEQPGKAAGMNRKPHTALAILV